METAGSSSPPIVLGLPRGGVVVGFEVARALSLELDVLVARKVGAPGNPELGIAAVAEGGAVVLAEETLRELQMSERELLRRIALTKEEVRARVALYRGSRPQTALAGRTALVVDDGLATGSTALAAILDARSAGASRVLCAVPVGASGTVADLRQSADAAICLLEPEPMRAIGIWYVDFTQVADEVVLELLGRGRAQAGARAAEDAGASPPG
ncbi:MAG: phosphoribosyltransferase [Solirubrobacteraceae bacterium]